VTGVQTCALPIYRMTSKPTQAGNDPGLLQIPISSLEHYAYCPRQAGLILLEDAYADDASTTRGNLLHQRVHEPGFESRNNVRTLRALPVWHDDLGLYGVCDIVEIHADGTVLPIEYKAGPYIPGGPADVQLAAQAMCLEAMFTTDIGFGFIYSGASRRRHRVHIGHDLRERVAQITEQVRTILTSMALPKAVADPRCRRCSMLNICMPRLLANSRALARAAS